MKKQKPSIPPRLVKSRPSTIGSSLKDKSITSSEKVIQENTILSTTTIGAFKPVKQLQLLASDLRSLVVSRSSPLTIASTPYHTAPSSPHGQQGVNHRERVAPSQQVVVLPPKTFNTSPILKLRLKCHYNNEIRAVHVTSETSFNDLHRRLEKDYGFSLSLLYMDCDDDLITLATQNDLNELIDCEGTLENQKNKNGATARTNSVKVYVKRAVQLQSDSENKIAVVRNLTPLGKNENLESKNENEKGKNSTTKLSSAKIRVTREVARARATTTLDSSEKIGNLKNLKNLNTASFVERKDEDEDDDNSDKKNINRKPLNNTSKVSNDLIKNVQEKINIKKKESQKQKQDTIHPKINLNDDNFNWRWQRGEILGQGAFGTVYLGLNLNSGELMAVKQLDTNAVSTKDVLSLKHEVDMMRDLAHPNIVRYLGTESISDTLSIFLEYVPGGSLRSLVERFGRLEESVIRVYTRQLLLGLEYLHRNGIAHRDVKGANVLVANDGTIKLADFGASKRVSSQSSLVAGIKGTPMWMAPEVIKEQRNAKGWKKADVWSVGCTVIEMATGQPPWSQYSNPVTAMYHIACVEEIPTFPESLSDCGKKFLARCLQRKPNLRPNVTSLLLDQFVAFFDGAYFAVAEPKSLAVARMQREQEQANVNGEGKIKDGGEKISRKKKSVTVSKIENSRNTSKTNQVNTASSNRTGNESPTSRSRWLLHDGTGQQLRPSTAGGGRERRTESRLESRGQYGSSSHFSALGTPVPVSSAQRHRVSPYARNLMSRQGSRMNIPFSRPVSSSIGTDVPVNGKDEAMKVNLNLDGKKKMDFNGLSFSSLGDVPDVDINLADSRQSMYDQDNDFEKDDNSENEVEEDDDAFSIFEGKLLTFSDACATDDHDDDDASSKIKEEIITDADAGGGITKKETKGTLKNESNSPPMRTAPQLTRIDTDSPISPRHRVVPATPLAAHISLPPSNGYDPLASREGGSRVKRSDDKMERSESEKEISNSHSHSTFVNHAISTVVFNEEDIAFDRSRSEENRRIERERDMQRQIEEERKGRKYKAKSEFTREKLEALTETLRIPRVQSKRMAELHQEKEENQRKKKLRKSEIKVSISNSNEKEKEKVHRPGTSAASPSAQSKYNSPYNRRRSHRRDDGNEKKNEVASKNINRRKKKTASIWKPDAVLHGHTDAVTSIDCGDWTLGLEVIATGSNDGTARLWNSTTFQELRLLSHHRKGKSKVSRSSRSSQSKSSQKTQKAQEAVEVTAVKLHGRGSLLLTGAADGSFWQWDLATGQRKRKVNAHNDSLRHIAIDDGAVPDEICRVLTGGGTNIFLWDMRSRRPLIGSLKGHTDTITGLSVLSSTMEAVSCGKDQTVKIWDLRTRRLRASSSGHFGKVISLITSGNKILSGARDGSIKVWDRDGACRRTLRGHSHAVTTLALPVGRGGGLGSGKTVVSGAGTKVRLWNYVEGRCLSVFGHKNQTNRRARSGLGHNAVVSALLWPSNDLVLSGDRGGGMYAWSPADGSCIGVLRGHNAGITNLVSHGFNSILSASRDGTIMNWKLRPSYDK